MNNDALEKIKMLKSSMRCFAFGLLSLVPVFGIPFAILAFSAFGTAQRREKKFWNAAKPYQVLGMTCAIIGGFVGFSIFAICLYHVANTVYGFGGGDGFGGDE